MIDRRSDSTREIKARLGAARSALRDLDTIWKDRSINKKLKIQLLQTLVWPIALYGSESWTLKVADTNRLHAFETACYRRLLNVTWRDHRTNESILRELGTERQFVLTVRKRKLHFFGHTARANNICTHIIQGHLEGHRRRGRPKRRWIDDVRAWTGKTAADCTTAARDRRRCRRLVQTTRIPDPQP